MSFFSGLEHTLILTSLLTHHSVDVMYGNCMVHSIFKPALFTHQAAYKVLYVCKYWCIFRPNGSMLSRCVTASGHPEDILATPNKVGCDE